jgi:hypothetical protein
MIEFECRECDEPMEVRDRMAGRWVRCAGCGEEVRVPSRSYRRKDPGLSSQEFVLFGLLFLFVPFVNVWVSSILYYVWKNDRPRRASHINALGFAAFGIHVVIFIAIMVLIGALANH